MSYKAMGGDCTRTGLMEKRSRGDGKKDVYNRGVSFEKKR